MAFHSHNFKTLGNCHLALTVANSDQNLHLSFWSAVDSNFSADIYKLGAVLLEMKMYSLQTLTHKSTQVCKTGT